MTARTKARKQKEHERSVTPAAITFETVVAGDRTRVETTSRAKK